MIIAKLLLAKIALVSIISIILLLVFLPLFPVSVCDTYSVVSDKMHGMMVNHADRFDQLRETFGVPLKQYKDLQMRIIENILNMMENFSSGITVRGMNCGQGGTVLKAIIIIMLL